MSQYVVTSSDNGGVHINSGIINRAYFILAAGLSGAIGSSDAERIFYRALTLHLQKQSQFIDARHACVSSAEELFGVGSTEALRTADAFDAVGIIDAPPSAPPTSIPAVQAPDSTLCLRFDLVRQSYYLVRREAALGDGSTGRFVNTSNYLAPTRLGGTAGDNVGVTQVTWSNNRGGNGTASGTTTWAVTGIALQFGTNVITATAHDAANNTGQAALTVAYNIPERVVIVTSGPSFGFNGGRFGFIPTGPVGQLVVVEASTDLVSWLPLWTNTFSGALNFRDPQSGVYSNRFYRAHTP